MIGKRVKIIGPENEWFSGKEGIIISIYKDGRLVVKVDDEKIKNFKVLLEKDQVELIKRSRRRKFMEKKESVPEEKVKIKKFGEVGRKYRELAEELINLVKNKDITELVEKTRKYVEDKQLLYRRRKPFILDRGLLIQIPDLVLFLKPRKGILLTSITKGKKWYVYKVDVRNYINSI